MRHKFEEGGSDEAQVRSSSGCSDVMKAQSENYEAPRLEVMKAQSENYEAPRLEVLGSIAELTQQRGVRLLTDNALLLGSL